MATTTNQSRGEKGNLLPSLDQQPAYEELDPGLGGSSDSAKGTCLYQKRETTDWWVGIEDISRHVTQRCRWY